MRNNPTRRAFVATTLATALALPALPAFALTPARAEALVDRVVAEINKVIASGKSESAMYKDFERIFQRYADVAIIARSTLGADARRVSSAQLRAYTDVFRGYMSRKYGKRFRDFIGGRVEVQSTRAVRSFHEVRTIAFLRGEPPFEVIFRVSDKSGKDLFFDMIIEGVSMLQTERAEIGAMLDRRKGNIDQLTKDLRSMG